LRQILAIIVRIVRIERTLGERDRLAAEAAVASLKKEPGWWVQPTALAVE